MANQEQIIEAIKEMSVLELNDLVKAQEEFGAAAQQLVQLAERRRKTEFDVELTSAGSSKSKLLKQLKKQLV